MCEVPPGGCRIRWGGASRTIRGFARRSWQGPVQRSTNQADLTMPWDTVVKPARRRPGIAPFRALVVHRDPEAASALVDVLSASNGSASAVAATVLADPSALATTLARGEAEAVVCALTPQDHEFTAVRETCDAA